MTSKNYNPYGFKSKGYNPYSFENYMECLKCMTQPSEAIGSPIPDAVSLDAVDSLSRTAQSSENVQEVRQDHSVPPPLPIKNNQTSPPPLPDCMPDDRWTNLANDEDGWWVPIRPKPTDGKTPQRRSYMKEWLLRIAIAAVFTVCSTTFTVWHNSPPAQPSPELKKVVDSLDNHENWVRQNNVLKDVALINRDKTVKIEPGIWYATVYTRKKSDTDRDYISESDWQKVEQLSSTDAWLINKGFYYAAKRLEMAELNQ